jgi:hypothetical protein
VGKAAGGVDGHVGWGIEQASVGGRGHGGSEVGGGGASGHVGELFGEDSVSRNVGVGGGTHGHAAGCGWAVGNGLN